MLIESTVTMVEEILSSDDYSVDQKCRAVLSLAALALGDQSVTMVEEILYSDNYSVDQKRSAVLSLLERALALGDHSTYPEPHEHVDYPECVQRDVSYHQIQRDVERIEAERARIPVGFDGDFYHRQILAAFDEARCLIDDVVAPIGFDVWTEDIHEVRGRFGIAEQKIYELLWHVRRLAVQLAQSSSEKALRRLRRCIGVVRASVVAERRALRGAGCSPRRRGGGRHRPLSSSPAGPALTSQPVLCNAPPLRRGPAPLSSAA